MTRRVVFLVYPGFQLLGLSGPVCAFQIAKQDGQRRAYEIEIVSPAGGDMACSAGLSVATGAPTNAPIDTLIVVGGNAIWDPRTFGDLSSMITLLASRARRIASICTGAFALAAAGLLNGKQATTHWRHTARLQHEYPEVEVVNDRTFTHDGNIWTSAGISAGIDLALALVEEDLGTADMRTLAEDLVVHERRVGGQPQFSAMPRLEAASSRIRRVLVYAQTHLAQPLTVNVLAGVACISERQLSRAFRYEMGVTVAKAIERLRADVARCRVEATLEPIELISRSCGFGDPERMRRAFLRQFGQPPLALRQNAKVRAFQ
jgi:transcriptional regulator GlxA family with amidase domain